MVMIRNDNFHNKVKTYSFGRPYDACTIEYIGDADCYEFKTESLYLYLTSRNDENEFMVTETYYRIDLDKIESLGELQDIIKGLKDWKLVLTDGLSDESIFV